MTKKRINLFSDAFQIKPEVLPFRYVWVVLACTFLLIIVASLAMNRWLTRMKENTNLIQAEQQQLNETITQKQTLLAAKKPDPMLAHTLKEKQDLLEGKLKLVNYLKENALPNTEGFSGWFSDLAYAHQPNLSLQAIVLDSTNMKLAGTAATSDAVPSWMNGFALYPRLNAIRFASLNITKQKDGLLHFELTQTLPKDKQTQNSTQEESGQ